MHTRLVATNPRVAAPDIDTGDAVDRLEIRQARGGEDHAVEVIGEVGLLGARLGVRFLAMDASCAAILHPKRNRYPR